MKQVWVLDSVLNDAPQSVREFIDVMAEFELFDGNNSYKKLFLSDLEDIGEHLDMNPTEFIEYVKSYCAEEFYIHFWW